MLTVKNLHVSVDKKKILRGVTLSVKKGEIHAIMGPNGSGKSTLAYSLMGHPNYEVDKKSSVKLDGSDLLDLETDERAKTGLFLAFQSPVAIPGVTVGKFLRQLYTAKKQDKSKKSVKDLTTAIEANKKIDALSKELQVKPELLKRSLNEEFSGGEKKKIETLQMLFLKPNYALVDEVDTGLDVDALKVVAKGIKKLSNEGTGVIVITHYQRILKYLRPDKVHVMRDGKIIKSGNASLAREIEKKGYNKI